MISFCQQTTPLRSALDTGAAEALQDMQDGASTTCGRTDYSPQSATDCACPFMTDSAYNISRSLSGPAFQTAAPRFVSPWTEIALCKVAAYDLLVLQYFGTCESRFNLEDIGPSAVVSVLNFAETPIIALQTWQQMTSSMWNMPSGSTVCSEKGVEHIAPAVCVQPGYDGQPTLLSAISQADQSLQAAGLASHSESIAAFCSSRCSVALLEEQSAAAPCEAEQLSMARIASATICSLHARRKTQWSLGPSKSAAGGSMCSVNSVQDLLRESLPSFAECSDLSAADAWSRFSQRVCLSPQCAMKMGAVLQDLEDGIRAGTLCPELAQEIVAAVAACPAKIPHAQHVKPLLPQLDCEAAWEMTPVIIGIVRAAVRVRLGEVLLTSVSRLVLNSNNAQALEQLCTSTCFDPIFDMYSAFYPNDPYFIQALHEVQTAFCARDDNTGKSCLQDVTEPVDFFQVGEYSFASALDVQGAIKPRTQRQLCIGCNRVAAKAFLSSVLAFLKSAQSNTLAWWQSKKAYLDNALVFVQEAHTLAGQAREAALSVEFMKNAAVEQLYSTDLGRASLFAQHMYSASQRIDNFYLVSTESAQLQAYLQLSDFSCGQMLAANATANSTTCVVPSGPQVVLDQLNMLTGAAWSCLAAGSECCELSAADAQYDILSAITKSLQPVVTFVQASDQLMEVMEGNFALELLSTLGAADLDGLVDSTRALGAAQFAAFAPRHLDLALAAADGSKFAYNCSTTQKTCQQQEDSVSFFQTALPPGFSIVVQANLLRFTEALERDLRQHFGLPSVTIIIKWTLSTPSRQRRLQQQFQAQIEIRGPQLAVAIAKERLLAASLKAENVEATAVSLLSQSPSGPLPTLDSLELVDWVPSPPAAAAASPSAPPSAPAASSSATAAAVSTPPALAIGHTAGAAAYDADIAIFAALGALLVAGAAVVFFLSKRSRSKRTAAAQAAPSADAMQQIESGGEFDFISPIAGRKATQTSSANPLLRTKVATDAVQSDQSTVMRRVNSSRQSFGPFQANSRIPAPPLEMPPTAPRAVLSSSSAGVPPPPPRQAGGTPASQAASKGRAAAQLDSKRSRGHAMEKASLPVPLHESPLFGPEMV